MTSTKEEENMLPYHHQVLIRKKRRLRKTWKRNRCPTHKKALKKITENVKIGVKALIVECKNSRQTQNGLGDQLSSTHVFTEPKPFPLDHPDLRLHAKEPPTLYHAPENLQWSDLYTQNHGSAGPSKVQKTDCNRQSSKLDHLPKSCNLEQPRNQPHTSLKNGSNRQLSELNPLPGSSKLKRRRKRPHRSSKYKKSKVEQDYQSTVDGAWGQFFSTPVHPEPKPLLDHPDQWLLGKTPPLSNSAPENFHWENLHTQNHDSAGPSYVQKNVFNPMLSKFYELPETCNLEHPRNQSLCLPKTSSNLPPSVLNQPPESSKLQKHRKQSSKFKKSKVAQDDQFTADGLWGQFFSTLAFSGQEPSLDHPDQQFPGEIPLMSDRKPANFKGNNYLYVQNYNSAGPSNLQTSSNPPPSKLNQLLESCYLDQPRNQPQNLPETDSKRQSSKSNQLPGSSKFKKHRKRLRRLAKINSNRQPKLNELLGSSNLEQPRNRDKATIEVKALTTECKKSKVVQDNQLIVDGSWGQFYSTEPKPALDHPNQWLLGKTPATSKVCAPENFRSRDLHEQCHDSASPSNAQKTECNQLPYKLKNSRSSKLKKHRKKLRRLPETANQLLGSSYLEEPTIKDNAKFVVKTIMVEYKKSIVKQDVERLCNKLSSPLVLPEQTTFPLDHPDPRLRGKVPPTLDRAPKNFQWSNLYAQNDSKLSPKSSKLKKRRKQPRRLPETANQLSESSIVEQPRITDKALYGVKEFMAECRNFKLGQDDHLTVDGLCDQLSSPLVLREQTVPLDHPDPRLLGKVSPTLDRAPDNIQWYDLTGPSNLQKIASHPLDLSNLEQLRNQARSLPETDSKLQPSELNQLPGSSKFKKHRKQPRRLPETLNELSESSNSEQPRITDKATIEVKACMPECQNSKIGQDDHITVDELCDQLSNPLVLLEQTFPLDHADPRLHGKISPTLVDVPENLQCNDLYAENHDSTSPSKEEKSGSDLPPLKLNEPQVCNLEQPTNQPHSYDRPPSRNPVSIILNWLRRTYHTHVRNRRLTF